MKNPSPAIQCQHCQTRIPQSGKLLSKEEFLFSLCSSCMQKTKERITKSAKLSFDIFLSFAQQIKSAGNAGSSNNKPGNKPMEIRNEI